MQNIFASAFALALVLGSAAQAAQDKPASDLGPVGIAATAERTLEVKPGTRYLNVRNGETVAIRDGERSVTWFVQAAPHINLVPLSRILPGSADGKDVLIYIAPGHQYQDF
ncbi:MAG: CzcE family metal-binding protein [Lysobacteraceae bacterium]|nr:MAG: CzcE family metal-binding protein [Xanthomonadaceae bacterium]